jgi:hypothetical protein
MQNSDSKWHLISPYLNTLLNTLGESATAVHIRSAFEAIEESFRNRTIFSIMSIYKSLIKPENKISLIKRIPSISETLFKEYGWELDKRSGSKIPYYPTLIRSNDPRCEKFIRKYLLEKYTDDELMKIKIFAKELKESESGLMPLKLTKEQDRQLDKYHKDQKQQEAENISQLEQDRSYWNDRGN